MSLFMEVYIKNKFIGRATSFKKENPLTPMFHNECLVGHVQDKIGKVLVVVNGIEYNLYSYQLDLLSGDYAYHRLYIERAMVGE